MNEQEYREKVINLAEKLGVTENGIEIIKHHTRSWDLSTESFVFHYTPVDWITEILVQQYFFNKYNCDIKKVSWEDINTLPFNEETKKKIISIQHCEKCLKKCTKNIFQKAYRSIYYYFDCLNEKKLCSHFENIK